MTCVHVVVIARCDMVCYIAVADDDKGNWLRCRCVCQLVRLYLSEMCIEQAAVAAQPDVRLARLALVYVRREHA
jgi:hypothetical protein